MPSADHADVRFPPPFVYLAGLLAGLVMSWLAPTPFARPAAYVLGGLLLTGSIALVMAAVRALRQAGTGFIPTQPTLALVQTGPYRITRNPMYVAMALFYLGAAIVLNLLWALILMPAVLFVIQRIAIEREELYLENKFGNEYRSYKSDVRRWL